MAADGSLLYIGYTAGAGSNEQPPPDWSAGTGWTTAYQRTGPGAAPYATCTKVFNGTGNPMPSTWSGSNAAGAVAHNGGVPLLPLLVVETLPTAGAIQTLLGSLPAGQKLAFQWQSEVENGPAQAAGNRTTLLAGTYLGDLHTLSNNLNTALAFMQSHLVSGNSASFYTRANFPIVSSAYMAHYSASPGDTSFIPDPRDIDAYGADFYQNINGTRNVGLQNDSRYQGYLRAVHAIAGANVTLALPEYGIMINGGYTSAGETARAALLAKDYAYMTGSSRPSGTKPVLLWNYWYQWNLSQGNVWTFPDTSGSETVAQAAPTVNQWQTMIANTGPASGGVTVSVTNPGAQSSTVGLSITPLQIAATDSAGHPLTFTATGLPTGLSISTSGLITGIPSVAGSASVTVRASDSAAGVFGTTSFTWATARTTISVTNPGAQSTPLSTPVSLQAHASDSASLALTWAMTGQPTNLSINATTGLITGTPSAAGSYLVTISAADSTGSSGSVTFSWAIGTNTITVTNPGTQSTTVGTVVSLGISASDSAGGQTLTYAASGLPTGLGINSTTGVITGTVSTAGTYAVTVTATDTTHASGQAQFSWVVNTSGPDVVTVVSPGPQSSIAHLAITPLSVPATSSGHFTLSWSSSGLPTGLSVNTSTGVISGTPTTAGSSTVTITATDTNSATSNVTFSWTVANAVVTVTDIGDNAGNIGNVYSIQMNGSDSGGFPLTWSAGATLPPGLSISSGGLISGTVNTVGSYSVVITATDSQGNTGTDSIHWTVGPTLVTVINPGDQVSNQGDTVSLAIQASDSNSLSLTYTDNGTLPAGLSINASTGVITGSPTVPIIYAVTITVTDTASSVGTTSFAWNVAPSASSLVVSVTPTGGVDKFGNVYPAGAAFGVAGVSQTLLGVDGLISLAGADSSPVIQLDPHLLAQLFYADPPTLGALLMSLAVAAGQDRYGNPFPAGLLLGAPLNIPEGANARMGTATLNGTTAVTVATTAITAKSRVFLTVQSPGGTPGAHYVNSITAGTSFTIKSEAGDTSTVAWLLIDHT